MEIKPVRLDLKLSRYYSFTFIKILKEEIISYRELVNKLIDTYNLTNSKAIKNIRLKLKRRLSQSEQLDKLYLEELRLLYTYIGHYLEKVQYKR